MHLRAGNFGAELEGDALVRLDAQGQHVWFDLSIGFAAFEEHQRRLFELDGDFGDALGQVLAGAQVEWHAGPTPAIDKHLQRQVGLGRRAGRNPWFLAIAHHLLSSAEPTGAVLGAYDVGDDILPNHRLQGVQDFDLFVAHRVGIEGNGRLHCYQGEQLQHVVLHHIADRPRFLVIAAAPFQSDVLRHCDLHMVNIAAVPYRLEDAICQAEDEDVLHRFFAQVVIDAVDLFLFEDFAHLPVEFFG